MDEKRLPTNYILNNNPKGKWVLGLHHVIGRKIKFLQWREQVNNGLTYEANEIDSYLILMRNVCSNLALIQVFVFIIMAIQTSLAGVTNLRLVSHMLLFEGLFVALDKYTRVPFSFLCYCIFKNYYRSICVSKCLLND